MEETQVGKWMRDINGKMEETYCSCGNRWRNRWGYMQRVKDVEMDGKINCNMDGEMHCQYKV